jgi:hypothetical protein
MYSGVADPVLREQKIAAAIAASSKKEVRPPMPPIPTTAAELANLTPAEAKLLSDAATAHTLYEGVAPLLASADSASTSVAALASALLAKDLKTALQARSLSSLLVQSSTPLKKLAESWTATFAVTPFKDEWSSWISQATAATANLSALVEQAKTLITQAQADGLKPLSGDAAAAPVVTAMSGLVGALA